MLLNPTALATTTFLIVVSVKFTANNLLSDRLTFTSVLLGKEEESRKKRRISFPVVFKEIPKNVGLRSKPWKMCKNTGGLRLIRYGMTGRKR